jgi:spore maturation protein CgeB
LLKYKILYICNEDKATTLHRLMALETIGASTFVIYHTKINSSESLLLRILKYLVFKITKIRLDNNNENKQILNVIQANSFDLFFIEKGLTIKRSTLLKIKLLFPKAVVLHYCLDDHMNPHYLTKRFLETVPIYDVMYTNKNFNVSELLILGAKRVKYFRNGYSDHFHRKLDINNEGIDEYSSSVTFIGSFEKARAEILFGIAQLGIKVDIWGWGREEIEFKHDNLNFKDRHIFGYEFTRVIQSSKINLCFLRKENRDLETTRSVEIPACGGFMLAERTTEHIELFTEGIHAVYFNDINELAEKVNYYLNSEEERVGIARQGYDRCRELKLGYESQMWSIIEYCKKLNDDK